MRRGGGALPAALLCLVALCSMPGCSLAQLQKPDSANPAPAAGLATGGAAAPEAGAGAGAVIIASWNVENLFDTDDDPLNDGDDEFTPHSWRRWTVWRYEMKLAHLARVVACMVPDILCLSEIENRRVLEDLRRVLRLQEGYELPYILHRDSSDPRGIDVAIMSRHQAFATNWLRNASRETLAADFEIEGRRLTVLANHWKSQLGKKEESDAIRRVDAKAVRDFLDLRLAADSNAAIVVTGDFNDRVASPVLTETAGFCLNREQVVEAAGSGLLYNLAGGMPPESRGTFWYNAGKRWESIDSMSVTRGMLPEVDAATPWRVRPDSYEVFTIPEQLDVDGTPIPFRYVRSKLKGNAYRTGYSDHFPIRALFEAR